MKELQLNELETINGGGYIGSAVLGGVGWESGSEVGAAIGTAFCPGIGTAIGGLVGGAIVAGVGAYDGEHL